jgi:subfamily B ATP-binding cassette protein MsbA
MNYFKKILVFAKPYKSYGFMNIGFNILYAVFNVLSILIFIPTLGILFGTNEKVEAPPAYEGLGNLQGYVEGQLNFFLTLKELEDGPVAALAFICLASLIIFFFKNLFRYAAMYVLAYLRTGMVKDLQDQLYNKTLGLPLSYFSEQRKGDLMARMTADVKEVESSIINSLEALAREPITIILVLINMLIMSPRLTLFAFIFLPIAGFLISAVGKRLKAQSLEAQKENGLFLSFLEETLGGLKIIKAFRAESFLRQRFEQSTSRFKSIMIAVLQRKGLASPFSEFLGVAVVITVLWFGGSLVLNEESSLSPQAFLGYIGLFYTIINPVKAITTVNYNIRKGNASAERIFEVLETENVVRDPETPKVLPAFSDEILFKGVDFAYDEEPVLQDFNLQIPKGKTVALVGQSGSGKSTVAQLLARFYDIQKGQIQIDGTDIRELAKGDLRNLIGMVTQEALLFNDTVRNNIALSNPEASLEEIQEAAKVAYAHDFIMELPDGYDTRIGDAGGKLSGGQRQRLSIARAVLKNPPILILDEATSALDTESEQWVQKALEKMMKGKTALVIAHRLSTIQNADEIVVMEKGKILEQGTHQELMKTKSGYKKLVELQTLSVS